MTKADIVRLIAEGTGLTKTDTAAVVDGFIESVVEALEREDHIEIRGFGTFKVVERAPRTGRNPRTGAEVKIASRKAPTFKPSKELRARVNGGKRREQRSRRKKRCPVAGRESGIRSLRTSVRRGCAKIDTRRRISRLRG